MEKPNFNTKEYRDNLARDIKEIHKTDPKKVKEILEEEKNTMRYRDAEVIRSDERKDIQIEYRNRKEALSERDNSVESIFLSLLNQIEDADISPEKKQEIQSLLDESVMRLKNALVDSGIRDTFSEKEVKPGGVQWQILDNMKKMGINTTSFEIFKETPLYLYSHSYYVSANESGTLKTLKTLKTYDFNESINLPDIKDNENLALQDENNLYNFLSGEDKEMQNNIEIEQNSQLLEKYTDIETVKMNGMNVSPNSGLYDSRNNIAEFIKVARIRNEEGEAQRILDETLKALKDYIVRNFEYVDSDNYDVGYYGERSRKKNFYRSDVNAFASANYEKALEFKMFDVARALTPLRNYITYNDKVRGDNWGSMSYEDGQKLIMRIFKKEYDTEINNILDAGDYEKFNSLKEEIINSGKTGNFSYIQEVVKNKIPHIQDLEIAKQYLYPEKGADIRFSPEKGSRYFVDEKNNKISIDEHMFYRTLNRPNEKGEIDFEFINFLFSEGYLNDKSPVLDSYLAYKEKEYVVKMINQVK